MRDKCQELQWELDDFKKIQNNQLDKILDTVENKFTQQKPEETVEQSGDSDQIEEQPAIKSEPEQPQPSSLQED